MSRSLPILHQARACTECADHLPRGPRPLLAGSKTARILLVGQAPGAIAHETGIPWNDRSGERLREWLGVTPEIFYDASRVALVPMGFCYPGKGKAGDAPPRPECAPRWHERIIGALTGVRLTVLIGAYAFERYLGERYESVTDAARAYEELLPDRITLPHPSPRNNIWLKKNAWFERSLIPALRARVDAVLAGAR